MATPLIRFVAMFALGRAVIVGEGSSVVIAQMLQGADELSGRSDKGDVTPSVVIDWNNALLATIGRTRVAPTIAARALAVMHTMDLVLLAWAMPHARQYSRCARENVVAIPERARHADPGH